jgi:hypothetical protein
MLTSLAMVLGVATGIGFQTQRVDTVQATGDYRDVSIAASDSSVAAPGPRRTLARVATIRETTRRERGTDTSDSVAQRRRAIEYGDWYYRRLTIHKVASFATAPLFVAEYVVGQKLFDGTSSSGNLKSTHQALATGIGVLFGVNTVTGAWNLWDSRHETQGRARRLTHAALMLASDAGFVATAALAPEGDDNEFGEDDGSSGRSRHRAVAIGSMGVSLVSYLMMYVWK